jgi:hypothetical protein
MALISPFTQDKGRFYVQRMRHLKKHLGYDMNVLRSKKGYPMVGFIGIILEIGYNSSVWRNHILFCDSRQCGN